MNESNQITILISALAAGVISTEKSELIQGLANHPRVIDIAQTFANSKLIRELRLTRNLNTNKLQKLDFQENRVIYQGQEIGKTQILYKSPLPGELQSKLSIESAIDRFLEYLQKQYQIAVLHESDYHVKVFIPHRKEPADFSQYWREFIENIAFSTYGTPKHNLPGLVQTFIVMLNSVTLAGRGFSTLEIPILTQEQSNVLAAWYLAIVREVEKRQTERLKQINRITEQLTESDLSDKERKSKQTDLRKKEEMQLKEAKKYIDDFQKAFGKVLNEQRKLWQELESIQSQLADSGLTQEKKNKLHKQQEKCGNKIIFSQESVLYKISMLEQAQGDSFKFVQLDTKQNPDKFKTIDRISKLFMKTATDQINATRGDIFTQCILEMYRLLENPPSAPFPEPLLSEQPSIKEVRSAGDDGKHFCYSCGVTLANAKWKVARFMFERPSQRRQSSSSEDRPYICASCSALAFASPLKVTDESIILKLEPVNQNEPAKLKVKDYIRMLTNKELHLSAGRYVVLASDRTGDRTGGGDLASQKLGQVQYALAKVASIFPLEVLADFKFSLIIQGSQPILLTSRHLIFIKGLIEGYGQSIIIGGKDVNLNLGDAVRYVEQDLPYLAEYTLAKISSFSKSPELEKARCDFWTIIKQNLDSQINQQQLNVQGDSMNSNTQLEGRAKLYEDVAALTGLTYPFIAYAEILVREFKENEARKTKQSLDTQTIETINKEVSREVSKIIENVHDLQNFCYFAAIGDKSRTSLKARIYRDRTNHFIYDRVKYLLQVSLNISELEEKQDEGTPYLMLEIGDLEKAYTHFANESKYANEKGWKELTYHLQLSLYTRFPELVRKLKSTTEKN